MNQAKALLAIMTLASTLAGCLQPPAPDETAISGAPLPPMATTLGILPNGATVDLAHDAPALWSAPPRKDVQNLACLAYDAPVEPTYQYQTEVPDGTRELRIAVEKIFTETCMRFQLVDPKGVSMRGHFRDPAGDGIQSYSLESILEKPAAGLWRIEVFAEGPSVDLRLRALARTFLPLAPDPDKILLPDLRPAPPWELKLQFNEAYRPGPTPALSCSPEENVQNGDLSACLRFSFATANIGQGRFELHYTNLAAPGQPRQATQWMYAPNGRHEERPAGEVVFHQLHGHYHWGAAYRIQLHRLNTDGTWVEAGLAFKRTACMFDYFLGDWTQFDQWPMGSADASNGCLGVPLEEEKPLLVATEEWLGLTPGWGDVYWWNLPDNYVKFDGRDGTYQLRFEVDPQDVLLETDEKNNASYVTFKVAGTKITTLERGYGMGPEDPQRSVVEGPWMT